MVVGAFPALKLFILAAKQASKPIAGVILSRSKKTPFFRNYICMPPAQFYNWIDVKMKMWILNVGWKGAVPRLSEASAVRLGADLLSELIVFGIGAGLIFLEIFRQSGNENKKKKAKLKKEIQMEETIAEMVLRIVRQEQEIRALEKSLSYFSGSFSDREVLF